MSSGPIANVNAKARLVKAYAGTLAHNPPKGTLAFNPPKSSGTLAHNPAKGTLARNPRQGG